MRININLPHGWNAQHAVSRYLKGYNLEMTGSCHDGMLADRLYNPKFFGTADTFGLPAGWRGGSLSNCRSVPGLGYSGSEALLVAGPCTLKQGGLHVFAEEELDIQVVAKSRHAPVKLAFMIKMEAMRAAPLAGAEIIVDNPCWKILNAKVKIPADCANAAFYISISGEGELHFDQVHLRPAGELIANRVVEAFRSLDMAALRFPGGCVTTVYDWKKGVGPMERRPVCPDPQFNGRIAYDFGLGEFLQLCLDLNCTPHITLPLGCGTAADAAELVLFCRDFFRKIDAGEPFILFQIGNEQYARHSLAHMSSRNYLDLLNEIVPSIRANYPNSKVIGLYSFVANDPWRTQLLDEAGGLIDMVAYQYYKGQMMTDRDQQIRNAAESVEKNRKDLVELIGEIRKRNLNLEIGFTEWNYWLYANGLSANGDLYSVREPMDAAHCLFIAGMIQMQAELGKFVTLSNFYNILNGMSIFHHQRGILEESSAAEVMRLYSPAFPGEYVTTQCDTLLVGDETAAVHAMGVQTPVMDFLFVVNYAAEPLETLLPSKFQGAPGITLNFADSLNGVDVPPVKEQPGAILPPYSITRFSREKT